MPVFQRAVALSWRFRDKLSLPPIPFNYWCAHQSQSGFRPIYAHVTPYIYEFVPPWRLKLSTQVNIVSREPLSFCHVTTVTFLHGHIATKIGRRTRTEKEENKIYCSTIDIVFLTKMSNPHCVLHRVTYSSTDKINSKPGSEIPTLNWNQ